MFAKSSGAQILIDFQIQYFSPTSQLENSLPEREIYLTLLHSNIDKLYKYTHTQISRRKGAAKGGKRSKNGALKTLPPR